MKTNIIIFLVAAAVGFLMVGIIHDGNKRSKKLQQEYDRCVMAGGAITVSVEGRRMECRLDQSRSRLNLE